MIFGRRIYPLAIDFLFLPTVSTWYPLHQKCRFPYLYFILAYFSKIIKLLFPLRYPIICDTLYLGGMDTSICMWSLQASASNISTCLYSHNSLNIIPISAPLSFHRLLGGGFLVQKLYGTDTYTCCGPNFLSHYFLSFEKPPVF